MLIFNQIYKKFLIQYVLFSLNLYRNLQTPQRNEAPCCWQSRQEIAQEQRYPVSVRRDCRLQGNSD